MVVVLIIQVVHKHASRDLAHIKLFYIKYSHGLGLRVAEVLFEDALFSLTVAERDWRLGERFSAWVSVGPTD